jgi:hypothetical protein
MIYISMLLLRKIPDYIFLDQLQKEMPKVIKQNGSTTRIPEP